MHAFRLAGFVRVDGRCIEQSDEGCDRDGKRERRNVLEAVDDLDVPARDAELFFEFAERGAARIAIGRIDDAAGKRELPGIAAQMPGAPNEHDRGFCAAHDRNDDGGGEHARFGSHGKRRLPTAHSIMRAGLVSDALAIACALAVKLATPSPGWIEAHYSNGVYPLIDRSVRAVTGGVPVCAGDVLLVVVIVWFTSYAVAALRRARKARLAALARIALRAIALGCALFVWFVFSWGYGYSRIPLADKIVVHDARTNEDTVSHFADRVVDALSRDARAAHRVRRSDAENGRRLAASFEAAIHRLGDTAAFPPPRVKPTIFQPLMELSATSGFTDPWTHEVNLDASAFPYERPAYYAHEWAHIAGFTDEAEANFIAVLACTNSHDSALAYSGWLLVWFNLPANVHVTHRISRLAYDDIVAIRARVLHQMNRRVVSAQHVAYDRYLKSNHVKAGYDSYRLFVRWMTGADFDAGGLPRVRSPGRES